MTNYVNKQNAEGLKKIGFDQECCCYYVKHHARLITSVTWDNHSIFHASAPDFLTAADWLCPKFDIAIDFYKNRTTIVYEELEDDCDEEEFTNPDHRDSAITKAIEIIEKRNK